MAAVLCSAGGHGSVHEKVLIKVPFHIKHHHHTHVITKHVYHKAEKPEYKVLGYTHDAPHGGEEGHGMSGGDFGGHSAGGDIGGGYEEHVEMSYGGGHEEMGGGHGGWE